MGHNMLRFLKAGETAVIAKIQTSETATKRLADIGFVRGARVMMVRSGRPCIVKINHINVGLGVMHQESILLNGIETTEEIHDDLHS